VARINCLRALLLIASIAGTTPLLAQAPPAGAAPPPAGAAPPAGAPPAGATVPSKPVGETKLVFDREVFTYPGSGRRDPFKPLVGKESLGPLFDDLKLKGIIYTGDPARSIVLIQDGAKRLYRLKRGDVVGNSRVVEIKPLAVRFAVENFGMIRYDILELRRGAAEQSGLRASENLTPANAPMPAGQAPGGPRKMLDSLAAARRDSLGRTYH
jgi:hypothetical protein